MFADRLRKRDRQLQPWARRHDVEAWRVYHRDIPELPFAVDRYADALHLSEYERPHDRSPQNHATWLETMVEAAAAALGVDPALCRLKRRERQRGAGQQYQRFADQGLTRIVREQGLRFEVNLSDYLDTGLFPDHRITRHWVRQMAQGRRVLNLFCYTGAFTAYALDGGAAQVVSVDASPTYLSWGARNVTLNGLPQGRARWERGSVPQWLVEVAPRLGPFDVVVVDPPTFSNNRSRQEVWEVQRDHAALLDAVAAVCAPDATIWFSTNARRFTLQAEALTTQGWRVEDRTEASTPPDFQQARLHRCFRLQRGAPAPPAR
jgi:23S rRNA (cytosine1962-C5)-methyltransferase